MIRATSILAITVITGLSACGGGGGGGRNDGPSFADIARSGDKILYRYEGTPATALANMPTSGKAGYRGVVGVDVDNDNKNRASFRDMDAVGEAKLTADFGSSSVTGKLDNFKGRNGYGKVSGTMNVSGRIVGNRISGLTSGVMKVPGQETAAIGTTFGGGFKGTGAESLYGSGTGKVGKKSVYIQVQTTQ
ncbi:transferrin-binding protein-like solute binding protein [Paracoccus pacificus]|uniref:Transferrin-binding protein-like solute binding protein n=1 Tax=Paracoccus pacificus TaxID=1463598 RepID=A0ABW4RAM2_9RHOB